MASHFHFFGVVLTRFFFSKFLFPISIVDSKTVQRSALCRSRRELSNEYLLAKFGFDTVENEPDLIVLLFNSLFNFALCIPSLSQLFSGIQLCVKIRQLPGSCFPCHHVHEMSRFAWVFAAYLTCLPRREEPGKDQRNGNNIVPHLSTNQHCPILQPQVQTRPAPFWKIQKLVRVFLLRISQIRPWIVRKMAVEPTQTHCGRILKARVLVEIALWKCWSQIEIGRAK